MQPQPSLTPRELENLLKKPINAGYKYQRNLKNNIIFNSMEKVVNQTPKDTTFYGLFPPNVAEAKNSCFYKVIEGALIGYVMGAGMGVFLGAFQQMTTPLDVDLQPANVPMKTTFMNEAKNTFRVWYLKGKNMGKQFFLFNAGYMGLECVFEKALGEKSALTTYTSSCAAGGIINVAGGPASMAIGCVGFMLFSAIIDKFIGIY